MGDSDGEVSAAYIATLVVRADPGEIRLALNALLDTLVAQESKDQSIVDWGTLECMCVGAFDPETGVEYVDLGMGVHAINVP